MVSLGTAILRPAGQLASHPVTQIQQIDVLLQRNNLSDHAPDVSEQDDARSVVNLGIRVGRFQLVARRQHG